MILHVLTFSVLGWQLKMLRVHAAGDHARAPPSGRVSKPNGFAASRRAHFDPESVYPDVK